MAWPINPRPGKSIVLLRDQLLAKHPGVSKSAFGMIGDKNHKPPSDHLPNAKGVVTALDVPHDPGHGLDIGALAESLRKGRDARIKYVIVHDRVFEPATAGFNWLPFKGKYHNHLHISIKASNYDNNAPWAIGGSMEKITDDEIRLLARDLEHVPAGKVTEDYLNAYRGKTFEEAYRAMSATARHNDIVAGVEELRKLGIDVANAATDIGSALQFKRMADALEKLAANKEVM